MNAIDAHVRRHSAIIRFNDFETGREAMVKQRVKAEEAALRAEKVDRDGVVYS